jgi:hypothetical protein
LTASKLRSSGCVKNARSAIGKAPILSLVDAVLLRALPYRDPSRLVIKMSNRYELEPRRRRHSWLLVPFEPRLAAIVGALAPAICGIYLVSRGRLLSGASLLAVWMVAFGWFAVFLQRRQFARVWITVPSAALVLIACVFIFFLVMRPG